MVVKHLGKLLNLEPIEDLPISTEISRFIETDDNVDCRFQTRNKVHVLLGVHPVRRSWIIVSF